MRNPRILATGVLAGVLATSPTAAAEDVLIDFKTLGTVTTSALTVQDVTITADDGVLPAQVLMLNLNGLGTVGGSADSTNDGSEALHFTFSTLVTNARIHVGLANNLDFDGLLGESFLEAFVGTTSLGVVAVDDTGWKNVSELFGGVAVTSCTLRADVDGTRIDAMSYRTYWDDLGAGLAGANGVPHLSGAGYQVPGMTTSLIAQQLLANTSATLVLGISAINASFKGGVLVPSPDVLIPGVPTGPAGEIDLSFAWPSGLPSGAPLYWQWWIADPAGPFGFAATNGLQLTTP